MPADSFARPNTPSRLPVIALLVATGIVAVVGVVLVIMWVKDVFHGGPKHTAYMQAIDDARRAGIPVTPQLLQAPLPPAEQNAAPVYTQLTDLLALHPLAKEDTIADLSSSRQMPSSKQYERVRRALKHRQDVMQLIHRAAAKPQCVFVRDWSDPVAATFKELATIRQAARLLANESLLMAHNGKPLDAVRNLALGFKLAQHVDNENLLISDLVAMAVDSITINGLQKILYISDGDPTVADAVRKVIDSEWKLPSTAHAFRSEAGAKVVILQVLRNEGPESLNEWVGDASRRPTNMTPGRWNSFIDENGSIDLKNERSMIAAASLPYMKSASVMHAIDSQVEADTNPQHLLVSILNYGYENTVTKQAQSQDIANITRAGAALLVYKGRHGAFPAQLTDELKPESVPLDPLNCKPLCYIREGSGFVIYSAGPDGKFDGGEPGKVKGRYDMLFRYPQPKYYAKELSVK